jgi:ABC-type histidine transport system ATPase subunit
VNVPSPGDGSQAGAPAFLDVVDIDDGGDRHALDPELVSEVFDVMCALAESGMTMIVVTHEIALAREVSEHMVFMAGGEIVEKGQPAEVLGNPSHPQKQA